MAKDEDRGQGPAPSHLASAAPGQGVSVKMKTEQNFSYETQNPHKGHLPHFWPRSDRLPGRRRPAEEVGGPRVLWTSLELPFWADFQFQLKTWQGLWFQTALI